MVQARQWWDERREEFVEFEEPELVVCLNEVEPTVLYGPDGEILVSWTPPIGFARAIHKRGEEPLNGA